MGGKRREKPSMLAQDVVRQIFSQAQAIITGDHLVYAKKPDGWYHGYDYVNKDAIYPHVRSLSLLCRDIADHFLDHKIEVVVVFTLMKRMYLHKQNCATMN
ncbi:MAG: hypothetical protein NT148_00945 [Candidatus Nealsonbacteria bacterium]|nr:hypothetical protein [Candidatus Nealsonbacteria bacterium]